LKCFCFSLQTVAHHHWKKQQHNIEPQCTASGVAKKPGEHSGQDISKFKLQITKKQEVEKIIRKM
jgi:hypothetical protein